jgi:hypothetical protein
MSLGSLPTGAVVLTPVSSIPANGQEDWYSVNFPLNADVGTHGTGTPTVAFASNPGGAFAFQVWTSCGSGAMCGTNVVNWAFTDNVAGSAWTSRNVSWPSTIFIRVLRPAGGTNCASYQLQVTR